MQTFCIAIAGNGYTLSAKSEDLIQLEFPGVTIVRSHSLDALPEQPEEHIKLLLVEEEIFGDVQSPTREELLALNADQIAFAYNDQTVALKFFDDTLRGRDCRKFGFLPMAMQYECWTSLLRLLFLGHNCLPQEFVGRNRRNGERRSATTAALETAREVVKRLTPREREILQLAAHGKQNKLIAVDLHLSEHTVKLHMHHIIKKLGVRNRTEAAGIYFNRPQSTV